MQLQVTTHRGTQTDRSPHKGSRLQAAEPSDLTGSSPLVQPRHRSSSFVAAITQGEEPSVNDGITMQMAPNREVLIVKDSPQDESDYPVHLFREKEDDTFREKDFEDVYQEFKELQHGDDEEYLGREPLRRSQSEEGPERRETARKRRRSFSEHNSNYSQAIDLEEQEAEEEEEEEEIFPVPEVMTCRLVTSHPSAQQAFRPPAELLNSHVAATATNPVMGLSPRSQQQGPNPAGLLLLGQRPEKGLGKRRVGGVGDPAKGRFLMPDVMENSETESAKDSANGSMESEGPPPAGTGTAPAGQEGDGFVPPPPPGTDPAFPSLPDAFLKKIGLEKGSSLNPEDLTGHEVESKFSTLSLAFKTDKFTLNKRLELQQRQRDTAEKNIDSEVLAMRDVLNSLNQLCVDSQMRDLITKLQHHLDIVQQSTSRMSSRAEVFGAVQQEFRSRMNSVVGSLVNGAGAVRLERLLLSGGGAAGGSASTTPSTSSPVSSSGPFPFSSFVPASSHVQGATHTLLASRHSAPDSATDSNREESSQKDPQDLPVSCGERDPSDRLQQLDDRTNSKGGVMVDEEDFAGDEDDLGQENGNSLQPMSNCGGLLSSCSSLTGQKLGSPWSPAGEGSAKTTAGASFVSQFLKSAFIRKGYSMLLTWLPDDGWWTQWDVSSTTRALRYGLGSLLFLAALFSLMVTFLPAQDVPACLFSPHGSSSHRSFQEVLETIFGHYVSRRPLHGTL